MKLHIDLSLSLVTGALTLGAVILGLAWTSHLLTADQYAELVTIRSYSNAIMPLLTMSLMLGFPKFRELGLELIGSLFQVYLFCALVIIGLVVLSWYLFSFEDIRIQAVISLGIGSSLVAVYSGRLRAEKSFRMIHLYMSLMTILGMAFLILLAMVDTPVQAIVVYQGVFFVILVLIPVLFRKKMPLCLPSKKALEVARPFLKFCFSRISSGLLKKVFFVLPIFLLDFLGATEELIAYSTSLILMRVIDTALSFSSGPVITYAASNRLSKNKMDSIIIAVLSLCLLAMPIGWLASLISSEILPYLFNFNDEIFISIERILSLIGLYFSACFLRIFYDAFTDCAHVTDIFIRGTLLGAFPLILAFFLGGDMISWILWSLSLNLSYVCFRYSLSLFNALNGLSKL